MAKTNEPNETPTNNLVNLARRLLVLREKLDEAKKIKANLQKDYDHLTIVEIPDVMNEMGMTSVNLKDIGRLGLRPDLRVSVLAENREELHMWLEQHGHGDLITNTVNSSTLKAWVKEVMERGIDDIPEDLIRTDPYQRATITKR